MTTPAPTNRSYMVPPNLRKLGIYVERASVLYRFCRFSFGRGDGSIYVAPVAPSGRYAYGNATIPAGTADAEFSTVGQFEAADDVGVKLSLHHDGAAHVHTSAIGTQTTRIFGAPLDSLRGDHIATVCTESIETLLPWRAPLRAEHSADTDRTIPLEESDTAIRLAIYANGVEPAFAAPSVVCWIELPRTKLASSLYVGLAAIPSTATGAIGEGVVVIGGWHAATVRTVDRATDLLFLRST